MRGRGLYAENVRSQDLRLTFAPADATVFGGAKGRLRVRGKGRTHLRRHEATDFLLPVLRTTGTTQEVVMPKDLPARPNAEHIKSQAKDLLAAYKRGDAAALDRFRRGLPSARGATDAALVTAAFALHDAQSVIARE